MSPNSGLPHGIHHAVLRNLIRDAVVTEQSYRVGTSNRAAIWFRSVLAPLDVGAGARTLIARTAVRFEDEVSLWDRRSSIGHLAGNSKASRPTVVAAGS